MKVALLVPNNYLYAGNSLLAQNFLYGEDKFLFSRSSKSWWHNLVFLEYISFLFVLPEEVTPQPVYEMYECVGVLPFLHCALFCFCLFDASESWDTGLSFGVSASHLNKSSTANCFTNVNYFDFKLFWVFLPVMEKLDVKRIKLFWFIDGFVVMALIRTENSCSCPFTKLVYL